MSSSSNQKVAEIQVSYRPSVANKPKITSGIDAYNALLPFYPEETIALQERFLAMYLNRHNRVLGVYPVSVGGITCTTVDVRLVLSVALKTAATGIILSHNHPSGNTQPSEADKMITRKISNACAFHDLKLLDHIIVAAEDNGNFFSFASEGLI